MRVDVELPCPATVGEGNLIVKGPNTTFGDRELDTEFARERGGCFVSLGCGTGMDRDREGGKRGEGREREKGELPFQ